MKLNFKELNEKERTICTRVEIGLLAFVAVVIILKGIFHVQIPNWIMIPAKIIVWFHLVILVCAGTYGIIYVIRDKNKNKGEK